MFTVAFHTEMSAITLGTFWLLLHYILARIADFHFFLLIYVMLFKALVAIKLQHMFFGLRKCYLFLVNN